MKPEGISSPLSKHHLSTMISRILKTAVSAVILWYTLLYFLLELSTTIRIRWMIGDTISSGAEIVAACFGATLLLLAMVVFWKLGGRNTEKGNIYGLQHGRLHLDVQVPMWMNMGYWKVRNETHGTMSEIDLPPEDTGYGESQIKVHG
jgi:hypothetical protein